MLVGCASHDLVINGAQWTQPDFAIRKHYAASDVVTLKPDYQTVVCLGCPRDEAFRDSDRVYWITVREELEPVSLNNSPVPAPAPEKSRILREALGAKHFHFDSYRLVGDLSPLSRILDAALKNPDQPLHIVGHTDAIGTTSYNLKLSVQRAKAVASWLKSHGVAAERIEIEGAGEGKPVATNTTSQGRAKNRRTEMTIVVSDE